MAVVFERPKSLLDVPTHYCPGCTHGIVHRLVAEVMDEMGIEGDTVGVCPVGCSVMAYDYFGCDMIEAPHGRAPAVATGVKRTNPDKFVFTYQGDGDLAAIGTAETVHVATRGENIVVIFINNTIYGMTGGQMAPTTLPGQVTQTTPFGRDPKLMGYPVRVCEMLATLTGTALAQRVAVDTVPHIREAKKAIRKAFTPEFLNRLDEQILFNPLAKEDIERIIEIELRDLYARVEQAGFGLKLGKGVKKFVADAGYDPQYGARPLKRAIQRYIEDPLAEKIISGEVKPGETITLKLNKERNGVI